MFIHSELIREARTQKGWTQQQLADICELSLRTIQRVENQGQASMETINTLCAVLELNREQLNQAQVEDKNQLKSIVFLIAGSLLLGFVFGVGTMFLVHS